MISFLAGRDQNCPTVKSPLSFFANLFKKKKYKIRKNNVKKSKFGEFTKVPKKLSMSVMDMRMSSSPCPMSPILSAVTLTPGRTRDIDQDMEALRLSRQDNPFLQVLASRESLVDSLFESESDDTNLMSQEFPNDLEVDPLSLPEIHEHMIRSPPPMTWPKSPNFKVFRFPASGSQESLQGDSNYCSNQFGSCKKSINKAFYYGLTKEKEEAPLKDSKFTERSDNCKSHHSVMPSFDSFESEENNILTIIKPTSIRSLSEKHQCYNPENSQDQKVEDINEKLEEEAALTLPLLSKKFI